MDNLVVNTSVIDVIDINQNTITVNFTSDKTLTDVKLSIDNGNTYKDKISMTQTSVVFNISDMSNNSYSCKLKGYYEEVNNSSSMTVNDLYIVKPSEMLEISYTTSVDIPSSCAWELRQNGSYLCSAYRDIISGRIVCYTGNLSIGTYNNITLVAKKYQTNRYMDLAISNTFSIAVNSSFNININKQNEIPLATQTKEFISNNFNLIINKGEVIPPEKITDSDTPTQYTPDLSEFGISTTSTPTENSNGFNALIEYASENKLTNISLPSQEEYIISKDIPIKLKSYIKLDLNGSIIKIEPNDKNGSQILIIKDCIDTELLNGTIEGDRYTHDYSTYNQNTQSHEFNVGVRLEQGSKNCKINNITFKKITGYGLYTSQGTALAHVSLNKKLLERGSYSDNGEKVVNTEKIRYSLPIDITSFKGLEYLQVGTYLNYQDYLFNSTREYTIYFYNSQNQFISKNDGELYRPISLPSNATSCKLVFNQSDPTDILDGDIYKLDIFTMNPPKNCEITNCIFDDNRCLGAAICGGWKIKFTNNNIKNTSAKPNDVPNALYQAGRPGYGIDVEDGWEGTQDLFISDNTFENNGFGDLVVMAGDNTKITNNKFTGRVSMYSRSTNYTVENNSFTNAIAMYETEKDYGATIRNNTYNSCTILGKYYKKPEVSSVVYEKETITGKGDIQIDTSMPLTDSNINLDGTTGINMIGKFINCIIDGVDGQTSSASYNTGIEIENSTITNSNFFITRSSIFNQNNLTKFRVRLDSGDLTFANNIVNSKPKNESMPIVQLRSGGTVTIKGNTIKEGLRVEFCTNEGNATVLN